ncbi:hypothetical protein PG995_014367 [Apiospora arundinis]
MSSHDRICFDDVVITIDGRVAAATSKPNFHNEFAGDGRRPHDEEKARVYDALALYEDDYSYTTTKYQEENRSGPSYRAYMIFVALWIIFAVAMWLSLPLIFCLSRAVVIHNTKCLHAPFWTWVW